MLLKNAKVYNEVFEPVEADVAVEGERIHAIGNGIGASGEVYDLTGCTLIPGLIDMHIHGCAGSDTGDATPEALEAMSECLVQRGVTSFCPTSMTLSFEELQKIFANVAEMKDKVGGAYIQGINMEGPYIAMSKKGAQNGQYVRNPDKDEFRRLYDGCGGCVSIVDIAPECDGAEAFIKEVQPYCPVSTAHTAAGYDQAVQAIEWGVRHTTHLYNAMPPFAHRNPGVIGAAFDDPECRMELICDGYHIHGAVVRATFSMMGSERMVLISDSMMATGMPNGTYSLGGQAVWMKDGKATLTDGETIAGSATNLYDCMRKAVSFDIPLADAIFAATRNPAQSIGIYDEVGSIAPGKKAHVLLVDDELNLKQVIM